MEEVWSNTAEREEDTMRQRSVLERKNKELLQLLEMSADTLETVLQRIRAGMEEAATMDMFSGKKCGGEVQKKYQCSLCSFSAARKNGLHRHIQMRHELLRYPCQICDYLAPHLYVWKSHNVSKHGEEWWNCVLCKYSSIRKNNLELHAESHASDSLSKDIKFPCDQCEYIGLSSVRLNYHSRLRHSVTKDEMTGSFIMKHLEDGPDIKPIILLQETPEEGGEASLPDKVVKNMEEGFVFFKSETENSTKINPSNTSTVEQFDQCEYSDSTLTGLKLRKIEHNNAKFKCDDCEYRSNYKSNISRHKKNHCPKSPNTSHQIRMFYCEYCEYSNCDQANVIRHSKTKHPSENFEVDKSTAKKFVPKSSPCQGFTSNECGFEASTLEALEIHGRVKHEDDKLLCDQCEYSTVKQAYLKKHIEVKHDGVRLKCNQCEYTAANKRTLINHEATEHNGVRFLCDLCGFAGKSAMNLQYHTTSTHQGVRYQCDLCDFKTTTNGYLKFHKEYKHQGMVLSCDQCEFTTPHRTALKLHKTGVHEGVVYSCDQCSYSTVSKHKFRRHVAGKHEGKTIKCDECDFTVPYNSNLKKHKDSVHRGLMNCDQCEYVATRNEHLKRHKLEKHGNTDALEQFSHNILE